MRRQPISSVAAAVKLKADATLTIEPPAHIYVPEGARSYFDAITHARPREDWLGTPVLLNAAANLAWTQWRIDVVRRMIDGDEPMPERVFIAQLATELLKMQRLEMGYLRVLQQHARASGGEAQVVAHRAAVARAIAAPEEDDGLLARPDAYN